LACVGSGGLIADMIDVTFAGKQNIGLAAP
jgi:hypothetical protein